MSDALDRTRPLNEIRQVLPHRYPFLLVDRILDVSDDGKKAVAIKNVSANEPFFQGHFPDNAIMPGVLIVEALAQAGGAALLGRQQADGMLAMLAGIDNFKFRKPVVPGDTLRLEVELVRLRGPIGRVAGRALVDGEVAAEGEITFALVPRR
ncbi:MAG TPA: 3-hydroxyacyl-ACP dehydratase FabZ [Chloroflexota bacterium]|nr:3-hydroxyacyl-ACP dehydratase FabZ [Chloroflexota bacterium]